MAAQEATPAPAPSADLVGNAFVEQYYLILHQSPELVHRFYQDSSFLSREGSDGQMTTVTTMQAINDKILSLNYGDYTAEIKTADAQESHGKGVIVLVTGCLTGKDNIKKKFTQSFFLAPQDKGYFVLNDVFRFVGETEPSTYSTPLDNGIGESAPSAATVPAQGWDDYQEPDPTPITDHLTVDPAASFEDDIHNAAGVCDPSDKEEGSVIDVEVVEPPTEPTENEVLASVDVAPASAEDAPKKSYASIVKVMKGSVPSRPVYVPSPSARAALANSEQQSLNSVKPAPAPEAGAPTTGFGAEIGDIQEEAEGHSIFVKNLPFNATVAQLEEAFKIFGPIKPDGIQVRSNKQGFCFGFIEFENSSSMQSALEATPVNIGDRQAVVEEKRTNTRVGSSGRGRYSSARSGFRSDSFKSRGNFSGGRGYSRNEFRNQGEFLGKPRGGPTARPGSDDSQRVNQNGSRRGGRQGKGSSAA